MAEENIIKNETKKSVLRFEAYRIFNAEWPAVPNSDGASDNAMEILENQLRFAGGFCTQMKVINLDTPSGVKLNPERLVNILKRKAPVASIESFVAPNVGKLESSDQVKDMVEALFNALGRPSDPIVVNTLTVSCDEVSNKFQNGNLDWIEHFYSRHSVKRIKINVSN